MSKTEIKQLDRAAARLARANPRLLAPDTRRGAGVAKKNPAVRVEDVYGKRVYVDEHALRDPSRVQIPLTDQRGVRRTSHPRTGGGGFTLTIHRENIARELSTSHRVAKSNPAGSDWREVERQIEEMVSALADGAHAMMMGTGGIGALYVYVKPSTATEWGRFTVVGESEVPPHGFRIAIQQRLPTSLTRDQLRVWLHGRLRREPILPYGPEKNPAKARAKTKSKAKVKAMAKPTSKKSAGAPRLVTTQVVTTETTRRTKQAVRNPAKKHRVRRNPSVRALSGPIHVYHAKEPTFGYGPNPVWPSAYVHVAEVDTADLEWAFRQTNHRDRPWWENADVRVIGAKMHRSTSVGDVMVDGSGGVYRVAGCGMEKL